MSSLRVLNPFAAQVGVMPCVHSKGQVVSLSFVSNVLCLSHFQCSESKSETASSLTSVSHLSMLSALPHTHVAEHMYGCRPIPSAKHRSGGLCTWTAAPLPKTPRVRPAPVAEGAMVEEETVAVGGLRVAVRRRTVTDRRTASGRTVPRLRTGITSPEMVALLGVATPAGPPNPGIPRRGIVTRKKMGIGPIALSPISGITATVMARFHMRSRRALLKW